jgi:hypothetical protein
MKTSEKFETMKPLNIITPIIGLLAIALFYRFHTFYLLLIAIAAFTIGFYLMGRSSPTKKREETAGRKKKDADAGPKSSDQ